MNGTPGSCAKSLSWKTPANELSVTAATRSDKPKDQSRKTTTSATAASWPPRNRPSIWQKQSVAKTVQATKACCNKVFRLPRKMRAKKTVSKRAKALPTKLKEPVSKCCIDMKLRMSAQANSPAQPQKRQSISRRYSCLNAIAPRRAVHKTPMITAIEYAWKVIAAVLKRNLPPCCRLSQSRRMGPDILSEMWAAQIMAGPM
mmetsp:Transcript_19744/g.54321  ORF Transcript_19744/g.54321 Transcript_19744/m.54321 type:complete len:202 (+) Transcript_19744:468-1073(+)